MRAADKGPFPSEADVPVEIYVMDPANLPPRFGKAEYTYFYDEDKSVGSHVAVVAAISNDTLTHNIINGELAQNNNPQVFGMSDDGSITLLAELDRETIETYELTVKAETRTSPSLVAYCRVTIKVLDINDNVPTFESDPYTVNIVENAGIGSRVVQVIAHDGDSGANSDISYDFAPDFTHLSNMFAIDADTGWISTLTSLDRESVDMYEFKVIASDRGSPVKLSDTTTVKIGILDHNDEPPIFSLQQYSGAMNEDALLGNVVVTVETSDLDIGINAQVQYYITNGDPYGKFGIQQTGDIYVKSPLDREDEASYDLTVTATDGAFVSNAGVHIEVLDANDNAPVCEGSQQPIIISENAATGTVVTTIKATDADEANTRNSRILYSLLGDDDEMFLMHDTSGIVSTLKLLDRETVPEYRLRVRAMDGGGLYCETELYIIVTDVNDQSPVFSMPHYVESIPEDAEVNTLITRVSATDADLGINRKVKYAMQGGDNHFVMDVNTGIVSLNKQLDREEKETFNITIYAYDQVSHLNVL